MKILVRIGNHPRSPLLKYSGRNLICSGGTCHEEQGRSLKLRRRSIISAALATVLLAGIAAPVFGAPDGSDPSQPGDVTVAQSSASPGTGGVDTEGQSGVVGGGLTNSEPSASDSASSSTTTEDASTTGGMVEDAPAETESLGFEEEAEPEAQLAGGTLPPNQVPLGTDTATRSGPGTISWNRMGAAIHADALDPTIFHHGNWFDDRVKSTLKTTERCTDGQAYITNSVQFTNATHGCRGGYGIVSGRLFFTDGLSMDATSSDATRLNGYDVYFQWTDTDGAVSPIYKAKTRHVPGASQGGNGTYAFYIAPWVDSFGVEHKMLFNSTIGGQRYKLWVRPTQQGPGGGELVAIRQGPGGDIGFGYPGDISEGHRHAFFLEGSNLQRTSIWAYEIPMAHMSKRKVDPDTGQAVDAGGGQSVKDWTVDYKFYGDPRSIRDDIMTGRGGFSSEPAKMMGHVWWESQEPDLNVHMPTSMGEMSVAPINAESRNMGDLWVISSVLTPQGVDVVNCGPKETTLPGAGVWDVGFTGWSNIESAWNFQTNTCEYQKYGQGKRRWDPRRNEALSAAYQKNLLEQHPELIAETVASYIWPGDKNGSVGWYTAVFDKEKVPKIPGPALGTANAPDGVYQYVAKLKRDPSGGTGFCYDFARPGGAASIASTWGSGNTVVCAPKLAKDAHGQPIVEDIFPGFTATNVPMFGPTTRWATSVWQFDSDNRSVDDMNHGIKTTSWSVIDVTNFDVTTTIAKPGDIAELDVEHTMAVGHVVGIRWIDEDGNVIMSPWNSRDAKAAGLTDDLSDQDPQILNPDCMYYLKNDEDPDHPTQKVGPGSGGCWLQVPENLQGRKIYTAQLIVNGDIIDVDSFAAEGGVQPDYELTPSAMGDLSAAGGTQVVLKNTPYWRDLDGNKVPMPSEPGRLGKFKHRADECGGKPKKDGVCVSGVWEFNEGDRTLCGEKLNSWPQHDKFMACDGTYEFTPNAHRWQLNQDRHGSGLYEFPVAWFPTKTNGDFLTKAEADVLYGAENVFEDTGRAYLRLWVPFYVRSDNVAWAMHYDPYYGKDTMHPLQSRTFDIAWRETATRTGDRKFPNVGSRADGGSYVAGCEIPQPGTVPNSFFENTPLDDTGQQVDTRWVKIRQLGSNRPGDYEYVKWKTNRERACQVEIKVPPTAKHGDKIRVPVKITYDQVGLRPATSDLTFVEVDVWAPQMSGHVIVDQDGDAKVIEGGTIQSGDHPLPGVEVKLQTTVPYTDLTGTPGMYNAIQTAIVDQDGKYVFDTVVANDPSRCSTSGTPPVVNCTRGYAPKHELRLTPDRMPNSYDCPTTEDPHKVCHVPGGSERWIASLVPGKLGIPAGTDDGSGTLKPQYDIGSWWPALKVLWGTQATRQDVNKDNHDFGVLYRSPEIEVTKQLVKVTNPTSTEPGNEVKPNASGQIEIQAGDVLTYQVVVTNTGDTTVGHVQVIDNLIMPMKCKVDPATDRPKLVPNPLDRNALICEEWERDTDEAGVPKGTQMKLTKGSEDVTNQTNITLKPRGQNPGATGESLVATGTYTVKPADVERLSTGDDRPVITQDLASVEIFNHAEAYAKEEYPSPIDATGQPATRPDSSGTPTFSWLYGWATGNAQTYDDAYLFADVCIVKRSGALKSGIQMTPPSGADPSNTVWDVRQVNRGQFTCPQSTLGSSSVNDPLRGAEFTLYKADEDWNLSVIDGTQTAPQYLTYQTAAVGTDGTIAVRGLPAGNYVMVESKAPEGGYQLLPEPIRLNVRWDEWGRSVVSFDGGVDPHNQRVLKSETVNASFVQAGDLSNPSVVEVADVHVGTLPHVGGRGVTLYGILGALLVTAAATTAVMITRESRRGWSL